MRRILASLVAGSLLAGGGALVATAGAGTTAKKTTICHRAAKKYVALTVSNTALKPHLVHHADVIGPPVPQNNIKAARAYCASLQVLTPNRGGRKLNTVFSTVPIGVTARLDVRLRMGQGQLCFNLSLTGANVQSATISAGGSSINLSPLPVNPATSSSGCVNTTRAVVKTILQNPAGATVTVVTDAGTLNGTLSRKPPTPA
jgi:hypothetical protein